jgi:hypothetical protein
MMTLRILGAGERAYRLLDDHDREVGRIRGHAIRFGGFTTEREAMAAAAVGGRALATTLAIGPQPAGRVPTDLRLVHDGAYEWIASGSAPLARLHRPRTDATAGSFAIEYVLPQRTSDGTAISAAQVVHRALRAWRADADRIPEPPTPPEPTLPRAG